MHVNIQVYLEALGRPLPYIRRTKPLDSSTRRTNFVNIYDKMALVNNI